MRYLLSLLLLLVFSCKSNTQNSLKKIAELPKSLKEVSGIIATTPNEFWAIEDSGNSDHIYLLNTHGKLLKQLKLTHAKNKDWEAITKDEKGNLYIGDFGNNQNKRKDLCIYKVAATSLTAKKEARASKITFYYPEQQKFPPSKKRMVYDSEAFFYHQGQLYIFTKNRSRPFQPITEVYRIPATAGKHAAQKLGSIPLDRHPQNKVTDVAISPDGKTLALLTYHDVYMISNFKGEAFNTLETTKLHLKLSTQMESICFNSHQELWLVDERTGKKGGNLYRVVLNR